MNTTSRLFVLSSVVGLFLWLFADALFGHGMFVFRDAAHFYYPLYQLVSDEWAAGRVPLWNPWENLGQPLAGNPTASVFYPGKLIFALPLSYAWAYKAYVMAHVLLAAWAAYRLARHFRSSVTAAGVCAISYAFSGNVLFNYCNVVFLVGAAWLPLAMLAADRMLRQESGKSRWAVALGVVLALMVLGGDPQMAYNAGLLAAMYAVWLWWVGCVRWTATSSALASTTAPGGSRGGPTKHDSPNHPPASAGGYWGYRRLRFIAGLFQTRPVLLGTAAAVGLLLSAVQVLPSMEFARRSGRGVDRSIDGLLCRNLDPADHQHHIYQFSVGPWRLAEYVWPNVGGRQFPVHRRWLEAIPAEGRIWTPSLYMGLLPLLMALGAMRFRRRAPDTARPDEPWVPWLSWSVVLAVLAGFGWYGLGWLIEEVRHAAGADAAVPGPVGAPFGGLYWLMTIFLPGYGSFRYPAKLLVMAALGLSVLAARGWDRTIGEPSRRFRRGLLWLGGLSVLGAIVALGIRLFWHDRLFQVKPDVLFGPLDTAGAADDLLWAFAQTTALCAAFWWLLNRGQSPNREPSPISSQGGRVPERRDTRRVPVSLGLLFLVAVDLAVANGWMVVCAPASLWEQRPKLATALQQQAGEEPYRVYRHPIWMRPGWSSQRSSDRLSDAMQWDRDTLWPKYHLAAGAAMAEVQGTMMPYDYEVFLRVAKKGTDDAAASRKVTGEGTIPYALAKYVILPGDKFLPGAEPVDNDPVDKESRGVDLEDVSVWHNAGHLPRVWIVHRVEVLPPLESNDPAALRRRTEQVLHPGGRPRDLRLSAVVECRGDAIRRDRTGPARPPGSEDGESCRVVSYGPSRVEIEAELARPGLVVLCDQFYPGWELEVETTTPGAGRRERSGAETFPILRANRVMRGAWLPAGHHRLIYRYCPASFTLGAIASGVGWIGLALGLLACCRVRCRRRC